MPSCSSKFTIVRENESNDYVETFAYFKRAPLNLLVAATLASCLLFFIQIVTTSCCSAKTNFLFTKNNFVWKAQENSKHYILSVKGVIKNFFKFHIVSLNIFKCKVQKFRGINICTLNLVLFQVFKHNVIYILIIFWLKISSYFILLNLLNIQKNLIKKLTQLSFVSNYISYEINSNSVMEVDETVKEINSLVNSLPNGDEIKEHLCSEEMVANGEIITNCVDNCNDLESKKSVDLIDISEPDIKLTLTNIKEKLNGSNEEVVANALKSDINDKNSSDVIINLKVKTEEEEEKVNSIDSRQNESSSEKDKPKEKSTSVNNNTINHVLSSSSSKKYDSHSRSHQSSSSSSSSRHKYKDSRDDKYKTSSSSSSKNNDLSSSSRKDEDKSKSDSRSKSRSCHHKPDEKCHCKSHHRSHHHSKKSKKFQSVKTQCTADEIAFELRENKFDPSNPYFTRVPWVPHPQITGLKYARYYRIEVDRNGGASVCHLYYDEVSHLPEAQLKECAIEFIKLSYSEDENECAHHVMGIVHGAAAYLPDLVDYMADHYPTLIVKTGSLASRDNHTTTMSQYRDEVYKTYSNGTFRYAPLDQLSICGVLGEEVGAYFPDFVARLEQSPFMKPVMPWSSLSVVETDNPRESNDGPIFWVRPGEQMLPANEALKESARPKKRRNNELDNLVYLGGSRSSEARESLFQDRTKAHADQVGVDYGISNTAPTAAVGVLKAVNCGHPEHGNRATKDVVAFHAQDYTELLEILMLDLYEPPQTQCTKWIEVSKLNTLRREGIRYAHLQLHDNDVYYLPRKIIHQFQTISSVASVAWHIRYRDYFSILGAPNLHTPTGINKGQVFYEKKNVAVYCPPVCENDLLAAVTNMESGLKTPKKSERLREYSPFKHSPRKLHKHPIPKKEKPVESTPPSGTTVKTEPEVQNTDQEKKNSSSSKKRERSKSDDGRSHSDQGSKREHESESRKNSEKSESSHSRRSSGDHTPHKKERKDSHSSHRKEVKNLDSEFSSKKDKSKRDKSPKSKHERRSDESKHNGSSKQRRHDESSSKSRSSKHDRSESGSRHEKRVEGGSIVQNGESSLKVKTEEENEKDNNLKRKHEDSPTQTPVKKIKEENLEVVENGNDSSPVDVKEVHGESQLQEGLEINTNSVVIKEESEEKRPEEVDCKNVNSTSELNENSQNNPKEEISNSLNNSELNSQTDTCADFDLRQNVSCKDLVNQVPSFPPPFPPSFPPNSPANPPPSFPGANTTSENSILNPSDNSSPHKSVITSPTQTNSQDGVSSKEKSDIPVKKLKKKIVKKENECYDLLGDIMSQMDKKK